MRDQQLRELKAERQSPHFWDPSASPCTGQLCQTPGVPSSLLESKSHLETLPFVRLQLSLQPVGYQAHQDTGLQLCWPRPVLSLTGPALFALSTPDSYPEVWVTPRAHLPWENQMTQATDSVNSGQPFPGGGVSSGQELRGVPLHFCPQMPAEETF